MKRNNLLFPGIFALALSLTGCFSKKNPSGGGLFNEIIPKGHILDKKSLDLISIGSSREQVLLNLGTPSLTSRSGDEIFYYISQTRKRSVAFMNPSIVDQKILALYFDKNNRVKRIANYGLKDSKIFDFYTKKTPSYGRDLSFIRHILEGSLSFPYKPEPINLPNLMKNETVDKKEKGYTPSQKKRKEATSKKEKT